MVNANALPYHDAKRRLKRELALEAHITRVLERMAQAGYLPPRDVPGSAESEAA